LARVPAAAAAPLAGDAELPLVGEALDWSGVPVDSGVKNIGVEDVEFESEDIIAGRSHQRPYPPQSQ